VLNSPTSGETTAVVHVLLALKVSQLLLQLLWIASGAHLFCCLGQWGFAGHLQQHATRV
jgi:hypothetical protein